jgi:hypothetical protein
MGLISYAISGLSSGIMCLPACWNSLTGVLYGGLRRGLYEQPTGGGSYGAF